MVSFFQNCPKDRSDRILALRGFHTNIPQVLVCQFLIGFVCIIFRRTGLVDYWLYEAVPKISLELWYGSFSLVSFLEFSEGPVWQNIGFKRPSQTYPSNSDMAVSHWFRF